VCGIAGIVNLADGPPPSRSALARMLGALEHRGPDERGVWCDRRAGLAHARLSIVDLSCGQQPMADAAGLRVVSYNGEIFNHRELRGELAAAGRIFHTSSDTEVLLQAWLHWGEGALDRFNGQWAFALWESDARRLVLARDRLGVRPLFLCEHGGRLLFASEAKAIFAADPGLPRALDPQGIDQTLTFWTVVAPRTIFAGISELEPGHVRVYERGGQRDRAYWQPSFPARGERRFEGGVDAAASAVRGALAAAVEARLLHGDVPVGSYLSGGLDSSMVTALAARAAPGRLSTFSIRFEGPEYDESHHQRLLIERLSLDHHELLVRDEDIAGAFPDAIFHAERMLLRTAPVPLYLLSRQVRDAGIKSVLTGEGADEVFAGYDLFREGRVRRFWARQPASTLRPRLLERLYPYLARSPVAHAAIARAFFGSDLALAARPGFAHLPRWRAAAALKRLLAPGLRQQLAGTDAQHELLSSRPAAFDRWSPLAQDQYIELRALLAGYLLAAQGDRMAMAHSVEGRFPFLDRDVVALAASLPDDHKLQGLREKHVLKRAAAGLVPEEILRRTKQPYRAPDARAFVRRKHMDWIEELLSERSLRQAGVFEPSAARRLWEKCQRADGLEAFSNGDNMALVAVLSAQVLHDRFVARPAEARAPAAITDRSPPRAPSRQPEGSVLP
jgi:asparagine synthase (glutamine-hydrolysing)